MRNVIALHQDKIKIAADWPRRLSRFAIFMTALYGSPDFPIEFLRGAPHIAGTGGRTGFRKNNKAIKRDFDDCPFGRKPQANHVVHADRLDYWPFASQWREDQADAPETASRLRPAGIGSSLEESNMSVIANRKSVENPATAGQAVRGAIASPVSAIAGFLHKTIKCGTRLLVYIVEVNAEARQHKAAIEAELYLNHYKHSSKNDDDLPVVR
jgi:hypothetical protein